MLRMLAVVLLASSTAHASPVELELGIGGAPTGIVGARAYLRGGPVDTAIVGGAGFGITGGILAVGLDQPVYRLRFAAHPALSFQFSLYGSYGRATLASWSRRVWGADENALYDGTYHWVDVGVHVRADIGRSFYIGTGIGAAFLVAHPDPIGDAEIEDEDLVGYFTATGWIRMERGGPMLWSSIGYRL